MSVVAKVLTKSPYPIPISLCTVVKAKESNGSFWEEIADLVSISTSGAGFYLGRECPPGHLVSLILPLPAHQRSYDQDRELYRVWGVVQHCHEMADQEMPRFHIGVAFIGKHAPESYGSDPSQNYRVCGMNENGLWKVTEVAASFQKRKDMRFWKSIDLYLALLDSRKASVMGEKTVTENISESGAAVISTLDINVGDRVKFISEAHDFSGLSVVCNRQIGDDQRTRLNLQFVENKFPIDSIRSLRKESKTKSI